MIPTSIQHTSKLLTSSIPQTAFNISNMVKNLAVRFQRKEGAFLSETVQLINDPRTNVCFYGIHRDHQVISNHNGCEHFESTAKRYSEIKSHILSKMGLQPNTEVIEVVGDSAAFSLEGTQEAMNFLQRHLSPHAAVVYGYTGHSEKDGTKCVNAAVTDYVAERGLSKQTIGNLVGFHTPAALETWGCTGPELNHYILVYGDNESTRETGTVFGDDITTSDFLSDKLLMVEGGIQTFRQACNFLLLRRPILSLMGLRGDKTRFAVGEDGKSKNYFTAPEFLQFLKDRIKELGQKDLSNKILDGLYDEYLSTRLLSDPKRKDYDTKKKLLDDAWKLFQTEKLYMQLHLFACDKVNSKL